MMNNSDGDDEESGCSSDKDAFSDNHHLYYAVKLQEEGIRLHFNALKNIDFSGSENEAILKHICALDQKINRFFLSLHEHLQNDPLGEEVTSVIDRRANEQASDAFIQWASEQGMSANIFRPSFPRVRLFETPVRPRSNLRDGMDIDSSEATDDNTNRENGSSYLGSSFDDTLTPSTSPSGNTHLTDVSMGISIREESLGTECDADEEFTGTDDEEDKANDNVNKGVAAKKKAPAKGLVEEQNNVHDTLSPDDKSGSGEGGT